MAKYKNCKTCGAEFKVSKDRRFYCSEDCRLAQRRYEKERARRKKKSNIEKIAEINRKAAAMGLDYGKYISRYGG